MNDQWRPDRPDDDASHRIAIIGMTGRFPGSPTLRKFWKNLRDGVELISSPSDKALQQMGVDPALLANPDYVKAAGIIEDAAFFDAQFFQINAREAEILDPQHRLFLETAWHALEDAGVDPSHQQNTGLIGVYGGCSESLYRQENLLNNQTASALVDRYQIILATGCDYLTTRVSYKLNLSGPSLTVQTGCSTSLVAVHLACQSLLDFQCDVALAGGVSVGVPQKFGHLFQDGMIYSPDNHCRAFDAKAQGIVGGEGVGIVVLKRLDEALTDGDHIHAVIKGSAINNDGAFKVGYTAPSIDGQTEVIAMAQAAADVGPETITYIEAHGTATPLGDPVEIAALRKAFQSTTDKRGYCAIGSVKTNIGHADAAAGIAGLIKTVLALQHRQLPPSLHFETPNPELNLADSPFYINTTLRDWPQGPTPRRAGVSSFGIGGTNAHIILEEAPPCQTTPAAQGWYLLPISAKTATALDTATHNLANHLIENADFNPADVAFSLQTGRQHFSHRRFALCQTTAEAGMVLQRLAADYVFEASIDENEKAPDVVFMFTGQGSQYPNMASDLHQSPSVFRQTVERCAEILKPHLGRDLRTYLYPDQAKLAEAQAQLLQTDITQPALFVIEYALAQQWQAWGVQPKACIGHSIGEYVAACLAGVFSLEDGLDLVAARGRLMQQLPSGAMLAVSLSEADLEPFLAPERSNLSLAALNTPTLCVVSGPEETIEQLQERLAQQTITCRRLHTSHAFHSAMVEPILQPFQARVGQISLHPPQIPFVSNVTGTWINDHEATDPAYWGRHLRHPVRFAAGLNTIWQDNHTLLLEVGPGHTLSTFARQHPDRPSSLSVISSLPSARQTQMAPASMHKAAGQLWLAGRQIDWAALSGPQKRYRIPLPLYPFERDRYWIEPASPPMEAMPSTSAQKKNEIGRWLYVPSWQRSILNPKNPLPRAHYLIFQDPAGIGAALAESLNAKGHHVTKVVIQPEYGKIAADIVGLDPQAAFHYEQLLAEFETTPTQIVHLWNVTVDDQDVVPEKTFEKYQVLGYYSLLYLTQALNKRISREQIHITVISNHSQSVTGDEPLIPAKSTTLGLCKVIPQEHHDLICQYIDIVLPEADVTNPKRLIPHLIAELTAVERQPVVAYRGQYRWVQTFDVWPTTTQESPIPDLLKTGGVYMITGGLGNVGLVIADFLARTVQAKLVLTGRSPFPDKATWPDRLARQGDDEPTSQTIRRLQAFEAAGAEVLVLTADAADAAAMQQVIAQTEHQFGHINGVIHAAGVVEGQTFRAVSQIERDQVIEQFQAKVQGTLTLENIFRGKHLDFFLLTSSLASILGGINFGIYAAGNAFLDAFAHYMARISDVPWLSVNWDAWTFGRTVEQEAGLGATLAALAMKPAEGQKVLKHLLDDGLPQIVVSTADLKTRVEQWVELKQLRHQSMTSQPQKTASQTKHHVRPGLSTPYVAPVTETEEMLVELWEFLLGFELIGVQDNFFDLGGHSLIAMQVISRILDTFDTAVPINFIIDAPTVAELAKFIEASRKTAQTLTAPPLKAVERDQNLPLSFAQQRLWFLDQLEPESHLYNLPSAVRLTGPLNIDALQRSLDKIIARHEALRTTFASVDGSPVQIINSPRSIYLPLIDLGEVPAADREAAVKGLCAKEAQRPFDLTTDLMMRASLYRLEKQEHVLLLVMHHIASDLWSTGIFFKEFSALYDSFLQGTPILLKELPIQYADYAVWQRQWLQGEVLETQLAYWKQQLDGIPPVLELPTDRPRKSVQSHRGASRSLAISETLSKALNALSRSEGVTLFMTLLAAFKILLHRYTGQDDIVLGAPIAGRNRAEIEEIIGLFIGTLVLRTDMSDNPTFKGLLHRVQKVTLKAYANQDLSFEKLVEELQPDRDLQRNPLFQVFFNMVPVEPPGLELTGLKTESVNLIDPDSIFDLTLYAMEDQSNIQLELVYDADLFDQDRMIEMLNQLEHLLAQIVDNPAKRIAAYSLVTAESKQRLSDPGSILIEPHQKLVTQMVAHWAEFTPDNAAVCQGTQTWTHGQLANCAEMLARKLIANGVVKGDIIAVYGTRSFGLIAGMLGALLSGGVMLPVDPNLPDQRKQQMVREATQNTCCTLGKDQRRRFG